MATQSESTVKVGTLRTDNPDIPTALQGATVLYTTRSDIKSEQKFVMIDNDRNIIKNKDGKPVRFGFEQYEMFVDKHYLEVNETAERVIKQDLALWQMEKAELARQQENDEIEIHSYDMSTPKEIVKDPSAHLFGFFFTCFIITLVVCLGRVFAPLIIERVSQALG